MEMEQEWKQNNLKVTEIHRWGMLARIWGSDKGYGNWPYLEASRGTWLYVVRKSKDSGWFYDVEP